MALKVLGSGVGRTGTASLKKALEQLGLGKCYHMFELFKNPGDLKYFKKAEKGEPMDWEDLLKDYGAAVDYPIARYYKQIIQRYPDVKVVHTVRDAESWYSSAIETIFWASKPSVGRMLQLMIKLPFNGVLRSRFPILIYDGMILEREFGKNLNDKQAVIAQYNKRNEEVINAVPKEQLLLFDVKSGWEPLCRFLNMPVPEIPFPRSNFREDFYAQVKRISAGGEVVE